MVHARIFELIKNPKDIDRSDCHTTVGRGRIYDGALVTMRLSGFGSAYAARGGDNGVSRIPCRLHIISDIRPSDMVHPLPYDL